MSDLNPIQFKDFQPTSTPEDLDRYPVSKGPGMTFPANRPQATLRLGNSIRWNPAAKGTPNPN
jgi:hypothetical protein